MVGLGRRNPGSSSRRPRPFCGASLITSRWAMTAAHCVDDKDVRDMVLLLGDHTVGRAEDGEVVRAVDKVVTHPHFGGKGLQHDIALLR